MTLKQSTNCVSDLKFHLIFVVKYRKKLLIKYGDKIKELLMACSDMNDKFEIESLEVDKDHVHMLISLHPTETIVNVVKKLKSYSTFHIWQYDPDNLTAQFWKKKMFWSSSYYVRSVGQVDLETVEAYIKNQGQEKELRSRDIHRVMLKH